AFVRALVANYAWAALLGAIPGILALVAALAGAGGTWRIVLVVVSILFLLLGALLGALAGFLYKAVTTPPDNRFGLCSGGSWQTGLSFDPGQEPLDPGKQPKPLAEWLTDLLDGIARQHEVAPGRPLTFGDLWDAGKPAPAGETPAARRERLLALSPADRVIDLRVITTNLSLGTPYRLPFAWAKWPRNESKFYFE